MSTVEAIEIAVTRARLAAFARREGSLEAAFKRLALKLHPDHGGDADAFRRLKEARDALLAERDAIAAARNQR